MRRRTRKKYLCSYFIQLSDDYSCAVEKSHDDDGSDLAEIQDIANELKLNLEESMFLETQVADEAMGPIFDKCMATQTRHVFFETTSRSLKRKPIKAKVKKLSFLVRRYQSTHFRGIMIDDGSTGSLCSEALLEAYRRFTGNPAPI